jgi:hypothetical protein
MIGTRILKSIALIILLSSVCLAQIQVSLPHLQGQLGDSVLVPVTVSDLTGSAVVAYDFTVSFNQSIIQITGTQKASSLSSPMWVQYNANIPDTFSVSAAGASALSGSGTLIYLKVKYVGNGFTNLFWDSFEFNSGIPTAILSTGSIQVGASAISQSNQVISNQDFHLLPNYPNPFNALTTIAFDLNISASIVIHLYDLSGRWITEILNQDYQPGHYTILYDASNLSSGIYCYTLQVGQQISRRYMVLLK